MGYGIETGREGCMKRWIGIIGVLAMMSLAGCVMRRESDQLAEHILKTRGEPLRRMDGLAEIFLRDFGAVPNDDQNALPALRSALQHLEKTGGNAILLFEKGRYVFSPSGGEYKRQEPAVLPLTGLKNVIIDGQGAEIIIKRPSIGFCSVRTSENIIVRNFTVDYDPLPFSQGTVRALDAAAGWIEVQTDSGFPALDDPLFSAYDSWGMLKDPAFPGKLKAGAPNVLFRSSCEKVGEGLFRIVLTEWTRRFGDFLKVGDRYAQIARASGGCSYYDSEQVTFENITFHAVPGSLFVGSGTSYLNVLDCRAKLKGSRLLTSGADGVHIQGARIGPWIEGCEFEGLSDDCLNIYSIPTHITEVLSPTRIRVATPEKMRVGDLLAFFRPRTGEVLAEVTVLAIEGKMLTLSGPVERLKIAPPGTPFDSRGWKIYDHLYNLSATGNYFVYRNNYMHDGRRYGAFIKASYGLIEGNRVERLSDCVFTIQNEPDWPEGFWARHLVIRDNRASDCAFNNRIPIEVDWQKLPHQSSGLPLQKNIYFEDNRISVQAGPVAEFNGIDGLVLTGNTFKSGTTEGPLVIGKGTTVLKQEGNSEEARIAIQ